MANEAKDLVLSYVVGNEGGPGGDSPVMTALESGYRVVDVLTRTVNVGRGNRGEGPVVVTVVLTKDAKGLPYGLTPKAPPTELGTV